MISCTRDHRYYCLLYRGVYWSKRLLRQYYIEDSCCRIAEIYSKNIYSKHKVSVRSSSDVGRTGLNLALKIGSCSHIDLVDDIQPRGGEEDNKYNDDDKGEEAASGSGVLCLSLEAEELCGWKGVNHS